MVVPSLASESDLQPNNWKGCKPLNARETFLLANFGVKGPTTRNDRIALDSILRQYSGNKTVTRVNPIIRRFTGDLNSSWPIVEVVNPIGVQDVLSDSILTMCAPGDLPYQKRFFDALLRCSIPVVIKRKIDSNGRMNSNGTEETYWSNIDEKNPTIQITNPNILNSYPELDFPYRDIVVEIDADTLELNQTMEYLESLPQQLLQQKFDKIRDVRTRFLYDFSGNEYDAFSVMLDSLWANYMSNFS